VYLFSRHSHFLTALILSQKPKREQIACQIVGFPKVKLFSKNQTKSILTQCFGKRVFYTRCFCKQMQL